MDSGPMILRSLLVVAASIVLVILISYYNSKKSTQLAEKFEVSMPATYPFSSTYPNQQIQQMQYDNFVDTQSQFPAQTQHPQQAQHVFTQQSNQAPQVSQANQSQVSIQANESVASAHDRNYRPVEFPKDGGDPNSCFPKDRLTSADLLPNGANTKWSQSSPNVSGSINDGNLLNSGFLAGISTVSGSMRNANLQIRSDPPITKFDVGPWSNSTITPDLQRKPFEIGNA